MENKVPSNANISATVKDMQDAAGSVSAASNCLKIVVNSLSSVVKVLNDDLIKNSDKFLDIVDPLKSYLDVIGYLMEIITEQFPGQQVNNVLGFVDEKKDKDGKIITKAKYTCIEALLKIGEVVDGMIGAIEKISDMKIGFYSLLKIQMNVFIFKKAISATINSIVTALSEKDSDIIKYEKFIFGTGETIEQFNDINTSRDGDKSNTNDKTKIITSKGSSGIMGVLLSVIELVNSFNAIQFPNYIKFILRIFRFEHDIRLITKIITNLIEELYTDMGGDGSYNETKDGSSVFQKKLEDKFSVIEQLNSTMGTMNMLMRTLEGLKLSPMVYMNMWILFGIGTEKHHTKGLLRRLFDAIVSFINSDSVRALIKDNIVGDIHTMKQNINNLKEIFKSIRSIMIVGLTVAMLAVPFILAIPLILLSVIALVTTMRMIQFIIARFGSVRMLMSVNQSTTRMGLSLLLIAGTILMAAVILTIIALLAPMIMKSVLSTIIVIGLIMLVVLAMMGMSWLLAFMAPMMAVTLAMMQMIGIMLITMFFITLALVAISYLDISSKKEKIVKNTKDIMGTAAAVIDAVFGVFDTGRGSKRSEGDGLDGVINGVGDDGIILTVTRWVFGDTFNNLIKMIMVSATLILTVVAVGMVVLLAGMLSLLYSEQGDEKTGIKGNKSVHTVISHGETIKNNVAKIMDTAAGVIDAMFGVFDTGRGSNVGGSGLLLDDGIILTLTKWAFGDTFNNFIKMIFVSATLVFTVIAVGMVIALTWMLSQLIDGEMVKKVVVASESGTIGKNVQKIMDAAKEVIDAIFGVFDSPLGTAGDVVDDGVLGTLCAWALGDVLTNFIKLILSSAILIISLIAVGLVFALAWSVNKIVDININEKAISTKINSVMRAAYGVMDAIYRPKTEVELAGQSEKKKSLWDQAVDLVKSVIPSGIVSSLKFLMALPTLPAVFIAVAAVSALAKSFSHVASLNTTDLVTKAQTVINSGVAVVGILNKADTEFKNTSDLFTRARVIESVSKALAAFPSQTFDANKHGNAVNAMIKFLQQINRTDLTKLQTTHNMLKEMKEFSRSINGNFQGLADTLRENIMPLLEELKTLLESTSKSVKESVDQYKSIKESTPAGGTGVGTGYSPMFGANPAQGGNANTQSTQAKLEALETKYNELKNNISDYLKNLNMCIDTNNKVLQTKNVM